MTMGPRPRGRTPGLNVGTQGGCENPVHEKKSFCDFGPTLGPENKTHIRREFYGKNVQTVYGKKSCDSWWVRKLYE